MELRYCKKKISPSVFLIILYKDSITYWSNPIMLWVEFDLQIIMGGLSYSWAHKIFSSEKDHAKDRYLSPKLWI